MGRSAGTWRIGAVAVLLMIDGVALTPIARGVDFPCPDSHGPDVIVSDLNGVHNWGSPGGGGAIGGYSLGTNVCNLGDDVLSWRPNTNQHPIIIQNVYRLRKGQFEQIGMSWVKHGFYAETDSFCCVCQDPGSHHFLGVGCSDIYSADLNGDQAGFNGVSGLGPRSEVNAATGVFPFPYGTQGQSGDEIYKRIQIHNPDLDPALNLDTSYYGEGMYVAADDAAAGNQFNNVSFVPLSVNGFVNGAWNLALAGDTQTRTPAIQAWANADSTVRLSVIDIPGDGRMILGCRVSPKGPGIWRYEYALYNMNSDRCSWKFSVPMPKKVVLTGVKFHDVDYHSGEPYDGTDWTATRYIDKVAWKTQTFGENVNANALRWGTLYNFRFNASTPPRIVNGTISLFKPGTPANVSVSLQAPSPPNASGGGTGGGASGGGGDSGGTAGNSGGSSTGTDSGRSRHSMVAGDDAESRAADESAPVAIDGVDPDGITPEFPDLNGDAAVDTRDLLMVLEAWGVCPAGHHCVADLVPTGGDGFVNADDLIAVMMAMGR